MAHERWDFNAKVSKFAGKSAHDCYKLIWQWVKEKSIPLSLFEELCVAVKEVNSIPVVLPDTPDYHTVNEGIDPSLSLRRIK